MTDRESSPEAGSAGQFPAANVRTTSIRPSGRNLITRLWLVTAAALVTSVLLVVWNQKPAGPTITIQFEQGNGLRPGNSLQHRGIEVGEVTSVELASAGDKVVVKVELQPQAKTLAREGSQFWIVRPRVSLTRVSGLETVVGARYIEVLPGPADAAMRLEFDGLETPLTVSGENPAEAISIHIRFPNGHGLVVGDQVRHRGIVVGEVTSVDLTEELSGVSVGVRLVSSASRLARAGSQFWIERPTLSAAEVRGLETLIGGRFIAVSPGTAEADRVVEFEGLNVAPAGELPEGGLEINLEATSRGGLRRGVPVLYRGLKVGHVIAVSLASDAATVEARAWIEAPYRHLVRDDTRFWMDSGIDVSVGLDGLKLSAEALSSIIVGSVSLATPEQPGRVVSTGHRFPCANEAEDDWLTWQPRLALGTGPLPDGVALPVPVRASLRWQERRFGFRRDRQRSGWVLPLSDGRIVGPADLLMPVESAVDGVSNLEASGIRIAVTTETATQTGGLAVLKPAKSELTSPAVVNQLARIDHPVDCLIVTSGYDSVLSAAASRFTVDSGETSEQWSVDPSIPLTADHHGAVVVSRADGKIVGFVSARNGQNVVLPVPVTSDATN